MQNSSHKKVVTGFVFFLRILSAALILFDAFWGFVIYYFLDWADSIVLIEIVKIPRKEYAVLDKYVDWVGYVVMLLVSYSSPFFMLLSLLFFFRLIGQIVFMKTKDERMFLFFPNFFDLLFFWLISLKAPDLEKYRIWFLGILILAPVREILLHLVWPMFLKNIGHKNSLLEGKI